MKVPKTTLEVIQRIQNNESSYLRALAIAHTATQSSSISAGHELERIIVSLLKDCCDKKNVNAEGCGIRDVQIPGSLLGWRLEASIQDGLYEVAAKLFHDATKIIDEALGKMGTISIKLPK